MDAKATGYSRTHVLLHGDQDFDAQVHNDWGPVGWVTRITRDDSTRRHPYATAEDGGQTTPTACCRHVARGGRRPLTESEGA